MKVKAILFLCLAASVAIWAVTEVQELGNNDAHDDSHESANLDAGDDHVDADDDDSIGEDMGVGRRGGFLSTTGSFQLSSGGAPAGCRLACRAVRVVARKTRITTSRSPLTWGSSYNPVPWSRQGPDVQSTTEWNRHASRQFSSGSSHHERP